MFPKTRTINSVVICIFLLLNASPHNQCTLLDGSDENVTSYSINDLASLQGLLLQLIQIRDELASQVTYDDQDSADPEFENEWAVEVAGGVEEAKKVARSTGYFYVGPVRGFDDTFIFRKDGHRGKRAADDETRLLIKNNHVLWAEQQRVRKRQKRDHKYDNLFNDPLWPYQWQLHDSRDDRSALKTDMNVIAAWKLGYTGKGVVVSILDDGIQHNHTDLKDAYDPGASYDLNDNDPDPMPTFNDDNRHGTRCAGEISMAPNNSFCGVGVAYGAGIGGVRMLDGKITDRIEGEALSLNINHIDIFSASWGPNDDGKTVEGPGRLAQAAIHKGIKHGRHGKGSIYVWASGNGGYRGDDCSCDGYADSVYTFSVSSAAEDGRFPWYGERCPSTLTTTYSTGYSHSRMIMTTDLFNKCATDHSGTSASAPMAAGIIALALEANPSLTWRDVQHIAVWTSEPAPLLRVNDGWQKNAFGLYVNSRFGFGMMNALAFVEAAKTWISVPQQHVCTTIFPTFTKRSISDRMGAKVHFQTDACHGQSNEVNFMEHVQLVLDISYPVRGRLTIFLTSPQGTRTQLLTLRREDKSPAGFRHWPFMSVHTWGEDPRGLWELEVDDKSGLIEGLSGLIKNLTLIVYGTAEQPAHYKYRRQYNMDYNDVTDERRRASMFWLERGKRIVEGRDNLLEHGVSPQQITDIVRNVDDILQREKRGYMQQHTISDFLSR